MKKVVKTNIFDNRLKGLKDRRAAKWIQILLDRLIAGSAGDVRPIGGRISELRIDSPGYRIYYFHRGTSLVVLLCGGD